MPRILGVAASRVYGTVVPQRQDELPVPAGTGAVRHDVPMRRYQARAEFRRGTRSSRWVLAGVSIAGRFEPAQDGVERVRGRLPEPGLVAWRDLPEPIVAASIEQALAIALDVARGRWPRYAGGDVPFPSGTAER